MKKIVVILISIFLLVLDNSLLPDYSIMDSYPSLLFIFAIAYSIVCGKNEAIFMGVISGILQDIYFVKGFGINSLSNLLLCFLAAKIGENILKENKIYNKQNKRKKAVTFFVTAFLLSKKPVFGKRRRYFQ